jgi:glycosyltransferase involved in cell wall biosynthesis
VIRVLYTIPNFDTAGSGKALLNIAEGLNKLRFEPHILCGHGRGNFFKTVEASGIPVHVFEYTSPMRPVVKGLRRCWEISRKFRAIGPDIVHSFHYSADYSEAVAAKMAGRKWVYTKKNMSWGGGSKNAWSVRSFLATRVVIQNTEMAGQFFANSKQKISLIPRGVDTGTFVNKSSNGTTPDVNQTVICVANLVPVKGVEVLIEAFIAAGCDSPKSAWRLKIVGEDQNEYGNRLKQKYESLIRSQKLVFTGKVSDVKTELESSEIFVLPTLREGRMEGSPVSLLEAMSMGLIVFGSEVPGITDQLKPLGDDRLFEPGNISMLAGKLRMHMEMSRECKKQLSEKIRAYCREEWDISLEVAQHERFYLEILEDA